MTIPADVAQWMVEQLEQEECLYQETVVCEIASRFGPEFVYINENGNLAIDRRVLREFRKFTEKTVVWERAERMWRKRQRYDPLDSRLADR
jgi:hypothetical protein